MMNNNTKYHYSTQSVRQNIKSVRKMLHCRTTKHRPQINEQYCISFKCPPKVAKKAQWTQFAKVKYIKKKFWLYIYIYMKKSVNALYVLIQAWKDVKLSVSAPCQLYLAFHKMYFAYMCVCTLLQTYICAVTLIWTSCSLHMQAIISGPQWVWDVTQSVNNAYTFETSIQMT